MKLKNDDLRCDEIKDLVVELLSIEAKFEDIDISVYTIKRLSDFKPQKYKLHENKYKGIIENFGNDAGLYLCRSREIFLFFNDFYGATLKQYLNCKNSLAKFILNAYHEFRHAMQFQKFAKVGTYENFIYDMEDAIAYSVPSHYEQYHDDYFTEIDADFYAVQKTYKFFERHPNIMDKNKLFLDKMVTKHSYQRVNYDFDKFFSLFCSVIKKNPALLSGYASYMENFFDEFGNLKSFEELLSNSDIYKLDIRILYSILSSNEMLKKMNFPISNTISSNLMYDALDYKLQILSMKYRSNVKFPVSEERYRKEIEKLLVLRDSLNTTYTRRAV